MASSSGVVPVSNWEGLLGHTLAGYNNFFFLESIIVRLEVQNPM